jgi:SAM-dependent methyltransferase
MQTDFAAHYLRCPACHSDRTMTLLAEDSDEREVREGSLRCTACGLEFPVHRGVGHLLHEPPEHVVREAAGLGRFAEVMRADGWDRDMVRRLPDVDHGYWYVQARSMHQLLATVNFQPGQWLLDIGSNTCWASNHFAVRGLRTIALDISTHELQGLYTSDYFIEDGTSYFERVLGSMNDIPLASASLDYVFCCEVLHHNDPDGLRRTFEEAFRVLKPGGKVLVINETLKTAHDPDGVHTEGVEQFEGYEHAHWAWRYRWEATRAGFLTEMMEPSYHGFFGAPIPATKPPLRRVRSRVGFTLRSTMLGRHAYLSWLNYVVGGVQLNMIGTKPTRFVGRPARPAAERMLRSLAAAALRGSPRRTAPSG